MTGGISAVFCVHGNVSSVPWADSEGVRSSGSDEYSKASHSKQGPGGSEITRKFLEALEQLAILVICSGQIGRSLIYQARRHDS